MRPLLMSLSLTLVASALLVDELQAGDRTADTAAIAAVADTPIGRAIGDFTLRDYHGKPVSLSEFQQSRVVVVAFIGIDCPLVRLYGPKLDEMSQSYDKDDVVFLGINVLEILLAHTSRRRPLGGRRLGVLDCGDRPSRRV